MINNKPSAALKGLVATGMIAIAFYAAHLEAQTQLSMPALDVYTNRSVIPEGTRAAILLQSDQVITVNLRLIESGNPTQARLSDSSVQLTGDPPSASISLHVPDNDVLNTDNRTLTISMTLQSPPPPNKPN